MTLQNKLAAFGGVLAATVQNTYHYWRPKMAAPFLVWAETGEASSLPAGNSKGEQSVNIAVDYYTKTEFDPILDNIQEALNSAVGSWQLNSVQFEEDTELIHYEWAAVM